MQRKPSKTIPYPALIMPNQLTIDGTEEYKGSLSKDAERICEKYPASIDNVHLFARVNAKDRIPWFAQLDEQRQKDIVDFAYDFGTLDRRRRELNAEVAR
jgi:hypothetical protein